MFSDAKRSELAAFHAAQIHEAEGFLALGREMAEGRTPTDLTRLITSYICGACSYFDHLHHMARDVMNLVGTREGVLVEGQSLFEQSFEVRRDLVAGLCPELLPSLFAVRAKEGLEEIPLLEPSPNELADRSLPRPMNMLLHQTQRPPMQAYATHDASVYAHPFRYQILSKDRSALWQTGSPRGLSRDAIGATELISVDRNIVVLQDRFNFANYSHFLFDGITRALLLEQALGSLHSSLLVFGGVPGDYHAAVCRALCDTLSLTPDNFYFPDHAVTLETSQRCIWFSDQVETYVHPAQVAHPGSIRLLHALVEAIPAYTSDLRRIYLSRTEAGHMRIGNEDRLVGALEARGFAPVALAGLSPAEQIGLFRGAEMMVAPHGMELTHLIAANRLRGVVELFPPGSGTDTYAFIARAGRISHDPVIGSGSLAACEINVEQVCRCIDALEVGYPLPSWHKAANLIAGSRTLAGFSPENGSATADTQLPEMIWGNAVLHHQAEVQSEFPVIGCWEGIRVIPGCRYTASCWVWIPREFDGMEVSIGFRGCPIARLVTADLTRREVWQRISTMGMPLAAHCGIELRLVSASPTSFSSTCWQLERGEEPTAYVETL